MINKLFVACKVTELSDNHIIIAVNNLQNIFKLFSVNDFYCFNPFAESFDLICTDGNKSIYLQLRMATYRSCNFFYI